MKKFNLKDLLLGILLIVSAPIASAWDGVQTGKLIRVDVTAGDNFGLRIFLADVGTMCSGGPSWAFLNDTDSNYKTYLAILMLAKMQGNSVTVFSTQENGFCRLGYISVSG
ncbi:MAG: hypothetical protein ABIT83_11445 [Massilia sp.]